LAKQLGGQFQIALIGKVFGENALAAIVAAYSLGYSPSHIHAGLQRIKSICGRFEVVERAPLTVVDYAHTPDALFRTLTQARELLRSGARKTARLICVFGCGGNKDASKRGPMGKIAGELADVVVITTDNPREEPPERIASAILAGARQTAARIVDQPDRKRAIEMAMNIATPLDVIVIAGKGHETLQRIGDQVLEFSDRETARQAYAGRVTE
jgi:UDP-N-acetylmuramoyl-L-alanyl-D-glutamate--2,6-diaminopimelate ligase